MTSDTSNGLDNSRAVISSSVKRLIAGLIRNWRSRNKRLPRATQHSFFMEPTGATSWSGTINRRFVTARLRLNFQAQIWLQSRPIEYVEFEDRAALCGIEPATVMYGYAMPIANAVIDLRHPFKPLKREERSICDAATKAIVDKQVESFIVETVQGPFNNQVLESRLVFEPRVTIRNTSKSDLWEFGVTRAAESASGPIAGGPSRSWNVLEVTDLHNIDGSDSILADLKRTLVTVAALFWDSTFQTNHEQGGTNFGLPGTASQSINEARQLTGTFNRGRKFGPVSAEAIALSKKHWSNVKSVILATEHFLQTPFMRLVDSSRRVRVDDGLIDAVIGLESLLLSRSERQEQSLRFAITGACLIGETTDERQEWFEKLKAVYSARSDLVHGASTEIEHLNATKADAESALRKCLIWFLDAGLARHHDALALARQNWPIGP